MNQLFIVELALIVAILGVLPLISFLRSRLGSPEEEMKNLRAYNMPRGSVRAMLALFSIGSFLNFLLFGAAVTALASHFDQIVTAFGTLNGAIVGFYFGGRAASPPPNDETT